VSSDARRSTANGAADDPRQIIAYASRVVADCEQDRVTAVRALDAGENHAVYKLSYTRADSELKHVVVRVASSERARQCAAATWEAAVLRKVQRVAAPVLHHFSCDSEWFGAPVMCTDFVDGAQRRPRDAHELEALGRTVGRVHALPTHDLGDGSAGVATTKAYFDARVAETADKVEWAGDPLPPEVQGRLGAAVLLLEEHAARARDSGAFETTDPLVLLHGDVAGANIIWTPDPVLIDWEYARIGDPADEIAYSFGQHGWTAEQRTAFWRGYRDGRAGARLVENAIVRVPWWEPVTTLGSTFFWVQRWARRVVADVTGDSGTAPPREQAHYAEQALSRLRRFEELLARPY
jgi:aminoglycoside phosphotransferase (APT) family kinase protein